LALVGRSLYASYGQIFLSRIDLNGPPFQVDTCSKLVQNGSPKIIWAMTSDPKDTSKLYVASDVGVYTVKLPCTCDLDAKDRCTFQLLAGGSRGTKDGIGTEATFFGINSLALDASSKVLYVGDLSTVRRVDLTTWEVKTVVGTFSPTGHVDGTGKAAQFCNIRGMTHAGGYLYVVDQSVEQKVLSGSGGRALRLGWGTVSRIATQGWKAVTLAGAVGAAPAGKTPEANGFGPFVRMIDILSVAVSGDVIFIGEGASIRSLSLKTGQVATAAGVLVQDFTHYRVTAAVSRSGSVFAPGYAGELLEIPVDQNRPVRRVWTCGKATGSFHLVDAMTIRGSQIYIADAGIGGICRVDLDGQQGTPCCPGCKETCEVILQAKMVDDVHKDYFDKWRPSGMSSDGRFLYMVSNRNSTLWKIDLKTRSTEPLVTAWPSSRIRPWGIAAANSALYVTSPVNNLLLRIDPKDGATRVIGNGSARTTDGTGTKASFCHPVGITTDGTYLYVGESHCDPQGGAYHGHAVRQIDLKTEQVTTLVGPGPKPYMVQGAGSRGSVNWPAALTYDAQTGAIYAADLWDNVVLRID